ncbi:hypothetical protein SP28804_A0021 [Streptococcus pneumoniae CDC0288-04]|nr:hypothetical protein SP28804_A0021 [Streptococcus pneumoniae CDC0288-04]
MLYLYSCLPFFYYTIFPSHFLSLSIQKFLFYKLLVKTL